MNQTLTPKEISLKEKAPFPGAVTAGKSMINPFPV